MQLCFMFIDSEDTEKVKQFLASKVTVARSNTYMIWVHKEHYKLAITAGINFIQNNNIQNAWWVSLDGERMPIDYIPLLFAKIPNFFKKFNFLKKLAKSHCVKYAKIYSRLIGQEVHVHYTLCCNVEFWIVNNNETFENHEFYAEQITKYCLSHKHLFSYITVSDAFGKPKTIINRNHSVECPTTKTPH